MKLNFPTETKARQEAIEKFVEGYMNSHETGTFVKDEHGDYMYSAGRVNLNLKVFFENLIDAFIEENESKKPEVGDKVKVLQNASQHGFNLGDLVTIVQAPFSKYQIGYECKKMDDDITWFLTEQEFEVIS